MMDIYLKQDGERIGPFTLEKIQGQLEGGQLTVSDAAFPQITFTSLFP